MEVKCWGLLCFARWHTLLLSVLLLRSFVRRAVGWTSSSSYGKRASLHRSVKLHGVVHSSKDIQVRHMQLHYRTKDLCFKVNKVNRIGCPAIAAVHNMAPAFDISSAGPVVAASDGNCNLHCSGRKLWRSFRYGVHRCLQIL